MLLSPIPFRKHFCLFRKFKTQRSASVIWSILPGSKTREEVGIWRKNALWRSIIRVL